MLVSTTTHQIAVVSTIASIYRYDLYINLYKIYIINLYKCLNRSQI